MSFVGLYTGLSGIRAAQTGMDTASHNIANANTTGYTRQRVEYTAAPAFRSPNGAIGTGVRVDDIARLRDGFLDLRLRSAVSDAAEHSERADVLASMERLSGEPDLGISSRIGELWAAAEDWSNAPNEPGARRQFITELEAVSESFRATATAWEQLGEDTVSQMDVNVTRANDILGSLEEYNTRLANTPPERVGGDLLDERDLLIDELAELTGATVSHEADNSVTVAIDALTVLDHGAGHRGDVAYDGSDLTVTGHDAAGVEQTGGAVAGGTLKGLYRALHEDLPQYQEDLNALAETLIDTINDQNQAGLTIDGDEGEDLLAATDGTRPAATIALANDIDIDALAAAPKPAGWTAGGGHVPSPHDGGNARAFADLRTAELTIDGDDATIESHLGDLIVDIAGEVRASRSTADSAQGIATGAALARDSQHSVSLDEEMVDLVRYQRALEANSRVMTSVDEALDVLVNRTGVVGR